MLGVDQFIQGHNGIGIFSGDATVWSVLLLLLRCLFPMRSWRQQIHTGTVASFRYGKANNSTKTLGLLITATFVYFDVNRVINKKAVEMDSFLLSITTNTPYGLSLTHDVFLQSLDLCESAFGERK